MQNSAIYPPYPYFGTHLLLLSMLFFTSFALSIFLFLLLLLKKNKSSADKILAGWLAIIAAHQLLFYLDYTGISLQYPHLLGLIFPLPLLHGIFLYFYVYNITREHSISLKSAIPHFIPFLLLVLLALPFYTLTGIEKRAVFECGGKGFEWYSALKLFLIIASGFAYVFWSLVLIRRHQAKVEHLFSNAQTLKWLEYMSLGLGAIWLLAIVFDDPVIFSGVFVWGLFIGLFGINQVPIFYTDLEFEKTITLKIPAYAQVPLKLDTQVLRYAKSGLKKEDADHVYHQLCLLMAQKALYKNNELTLHELAGTLNIHPNYLSQIINEKEQKNFYQYINTLRVQEFIRVASLPKNKHYTVLALAYDCGFNSKSTFNKYFRQYTGKTPSDFFQTQVVV